MVLVRVRNDEPDQILPHPLDETEIRHDEIDAGKIVARKGDAKVDHQPFPRPRRPVAVKRAIHPDFAQPAEGYENELVLIRHYDPVLPRIPADCAASGASSD